MEVRVTFLLDLDDLPDILWDDGVSFEQMKKLILALDASCADVEFTEGLIKALQKSLDKSK